MPKLRIIPLGGLGEIGKNMTALEYDGAILVVDAGNERAARGRPSERQAHLLQERRVARVALQAPEQGIALHDGEAAVALRVRALEPRERLVALAAEGVDLGDLVGRLRRVPGDELLERRVRLVVLVEVVLGDGRLSLENEPARHYDLLVVDAFSGDAIPVHLLTKQALELYFRHLEPGGILALHITNAHLDLEPVVQMLASALGKHALLVSTDSDEERKISSCQWALISTRPIESPEMLEKARGLKGKPGLRLWTDDYNNLFQILK